MNDRYLYRAKRTDNREWVEGYYLEFEGKSYITCLSETIIQIIHVAYTDEPSIANFNMRAFEVDSSTICRYSGYKEIWEHDIFQCDEERYTIEYDDVSLVWNAVAVIGLESVELGEFHLDEIDIIGNIFDNPELLEVGE